MRATLLGPLLAALIGPLAAAIAAPAAAGELSHSGNFAEPRASWTGYLLAAGERHAVVPVQGWDEEGDRVFVLDLESGALARELVPPEGWFGDFGDGLPALDAGRAVVCGDTYLDREAPRAYSFLYDMATGDELARFAMPSYAPHRTGFGSACALDGADVLVNASRWDGEFKDDGAVFHYDATTGALIRAIRPPEPVRNGRFGARLAISGGIAAITQSRAPTDPVLEAEGRVYLYDLASGAFLHTIRKPGWRIGAFGSGIAMDAGRLLVGSAPGRFQGRRAGAAFLYDVATGELILGVTAPKQSRSSWFGATVALSGDHALIGASDARTAKGKTGAAFLYELPSGRVVQTITAPDPEPGGDFGARVTLGPGGAAIGAPGDTRSGAFAGQVQLYRWATR